MTAQTSILLFTDLDGTLLGSEDYRYDAALPLLARLQTQQIPVIPVTSKTRAEVAGLRAAVGLRDPFVVENGSGIFIPQGDPRFPVAGETWGDYTLVRLGGDYATTRQALRQLEQVLGLPLQGFGDLTVAQIQQLTGLAPQDAAEAKQRDFTEPFVTPKGLSPQTLEGAAEELGWQVVVGDRFSHLISPQAGKGKAVQALVKIYQTSDRLLTIGLGNSPNDLPMLEAVDLPIILPSVKGIHPGLAGRGWRVAPCPAPEGWARVLEEVLL
ncbi:HAD-IIB family hydrolase [Spirulina subsalsa FACHB-351]|uniref:HAD-IIB family hydrolase n=1 Tax=Spirulina subsalsa FACHB-351 TaxID=234711 RepID=A0ABT3L256_9CYAN|nr:HAD-IIB family hydrolase [Spirulina subsalsa]MCW6035586.1 HAD-IIB family hydrolase [Spirulina subsalsa FACHB-351]